jgi:hypothetical protein
MDEAVAFLVALEWGVSLKYTSPPFFGFQKGDKKILLNIQRGVFNGATATLNNHRRHEKETHVLLYTPNKPLSNVALVESKDFWDATNDGVVNLKQVADKIKWKQRINETR